MSISRHAGRTKILEFPKTASLALTAGDFVSLSLVTGRLIRFISDTALTVLGVLRESALASDTTTDALSVEVPTEMFVEWLFDVDSDGGLADSDVGHYLDTDTDGRTIDANSSVEDTILVVKRISATQGVGVIARGAVNKAAGQIA